MTINETNQNREEESYSAGCFIVAMSLSLVDVRVHIIALIHIAPFLSLLLSPSPSATFHLSVDMQFFLLYEKEVALGATVREKMTDHYEYKTIFSKANKNGQYLSRFVSA